MDILNIITAVFNALIGWGINPIIVLIVIALGACNVFIVEGVKQIPLPAIFTKYFFVIPFVTALILAGILTAIIYPLVGFRISYYLFGWLSIYSIGQIAFKFWDKWKTKI